MHVGRGRALHCEIREVADFRARGARADETNINTDKPISLASGRTFSKAMIFNVLHWGGWLLLGATLWPSNAAREGNVAAVVDILMWALTGAAVSLAFRPVLRWARSARLSLRYLAVVVLALSAFGAAIWYVSSHALNVALLAGIMRFPVLVPIFQKMATEMAKDPWLIPPFNYWTFFTCTQLTWCSLYIGITSMLDLEIEHAHTVQARKLADSARLSALQSQLNPHFLFNSLNGIATLIREGERGTAADMVDRLGDFLRLTLQKLDSPEIPVREELAFVEQYLHIQRLRFGSYFRSSVEADPETYDALVPTLILQPLVENAVRHGVLARGQGGTLTVSIRRCDESLVITVEDDGPGLADSGAHPYGVGLKNSAERLVALYGDDAHMSVGPRPYARGFSVIVFLPFRTAPATPATPSIPAPRAVAV